jgi:Tfp pilus assembly protein PilO
MLTLKPREGRLIGIAGAAALAIGAYFYVIEPLVLRAREIDTLARAREASLDRRRLLVAQRSRLTEELDAVTKQLDSEAVRLLRGPTAPLAASELQNFIKDVAAAGSVEVRSERVLPAVDRDGLQEVPIELTIAGSLRDTVAILARLERADRLLTLKDLKIRVAAPGQRDLVMTLTVAGYLLPGSASAATPTTVATPPLKGDK